ncbi:Regulator of nonsense transcripts upf2 [Ancistrocladus abbreviatus]
MAVCKRLWQEITKSDSGSSTIGPEGHDDDDDLDDDNHDDCCESKDEDGRGDQPSSNKDKENHVRQKVPAMSLRRKLNLTGNSELLQRFGRASDETLDEEGGNNEVQGKVLVKHGHKQQTKQMFIPQDCSLVRSTKQKEAVELEEQDIKRLILEYNDGHGVGNRTIGSLQSKVSRVTGSRGSSLWERSAGRGSGHHRQQYHYSVAEEVQGSAPCAIMRWGNLDSACDASASRAEKSRAVNGVWLCDFNDSLG